MHQNSFADTKMDFQGMVLVLLCLLASFVVNVSSESAHINK